jgi:hypothetical protein
MSNSSLCSAEERSVAGDMQAVYAAYTELLPLTADKERFLDPKNEKTIQNLLRAISKQFHSLEDGDKNNPVVKEMQQAVRRAHELLQDSEKRFNEGKKTYALWRLRSLSSYCVSCHTRVDAPVDFISGNEKELSSLNQYQKALFFFTTRQFERAAALFLEVAQSEQFRFERLDALRRWMVIYCRVHPSPTLALKTMTGLLDENRLSVFERAEVENWIGALKRWQRNPTPTFRNNTQKIEFAEKLVSEARANGNDFDSGNGLVELLRASALLHLVHDQNKEAGPDQAKTLLLLGTIYRSLPQLFTSELPEIFLEQCIREYPGTVLAQKCHHEYQGYMADLYTGSSGTNIPDLERAQIEELRRVAEGIR